MHRTLALYGSFVPCSPVIFQPGLTMLVFHSSHMKDSISLICGIIAGDRIPYLFCSFLPGPQRNTFFIVTGLKDIDTSDFVIDGFRFCVSYCLYYFYVLWTLLLTTSRSWALMCILYANGFLTSTNTVNAWQWIRIIKRFSFTLFFQIQNADDVLITPLEKFRKEQIGAAKVSERKSSNKACHPLSTKNFQQVNHQHNLTLWYDILTVHFAQTH